MKHLRDCPGGGVRLLDSSISRHGTRPARGRYDVGRSAAFQSRPEQRRQCQDGDVASDSRMVALGFGKLARADRIFAVERITGDERGDGRRTRVWVDGVADPLIASRTEVTILRDMGQEAAAATT